MRQCLKIFFGSEGTKPFLVLLCLLVGGTLEAIGIGAFLPAIAAISNGGGQASPFEQAYKTAIESLGLSPSLDTLLLVAVIFITLRSLLLFGAMSYAGISGARVSNDLRKRLVKAVFEAKWSYYSSQSGGNLATAMSSDAQRAGDAYNLSAASIAIFMQIIGYVVVALLIDWRVAVLGIACGLLISLASRGLFRMARGAGFRMTERTAILTTDMVDMLQNVKPIKAMERQAPMLQHLAKTMQRLKRAFYRHYLARNGLAYGTDILVIWMVALLAFLALRVGNISIPEMLVFGVLVFQLLNFFTKALRQLQSAAAIEAAHVRITDIIRDAEAAAEDKGGSKLPDTRSSLRLDRVSFSYGDMPIIRNASLEVPARKITVLQGPSGAGKTTLVDLLIGLHKAQSGSVLIGNDRIETLDLASWRRSIGYVPQELALFHDTIRENITLSEPSVKDEAIAQALSLAGLSDFVGSLPQGLDTDVGEFGGKLSGGQRQRISLARALVRNPEVLILDEVTSALDPVTETDIVRNISRLRGQFTIIVITHRPAWTAVADHLYKVSAGRVSKSPIKPKSRKT